MKRLSSFSLVVALSLLLASCGHEKTSSGVGDESAESRGEDANFFGGGKMKDCVNNPKPVFTRNVTRLEDIDYLVEWGNVFGGSLKGHSYLHNRNTGYSGGKLQGIKRVPVYAPVDSYLISYAHTRLSSSLMKDEFWLTFQVSCEVAYKFDHIDQLAGNVKAKLGATPYKVDDSRTTALRQPIFVKAGELIGTTQGTPQTGSWDFGVYNTTRNNRLGESVQRFKGTGEGENYRYADCPYDYYKKTKREVYYAKLRKKTCGPAN